MMCHDHMDLVMKKDPDSAIESFLDESCFITKKSYDSGNKLFSAIDTQRRLKTIFHPDTLDYFNKQKLKNLQHKKSGL